jgi:hypothetical protein
LRRLTALTAFAVLAAAPVAHAAPLGELPFAPVPDRGVATCVERTGAAGLALLGTSSRRQTATDLMTVRDGQITRTGRVRIGRLFTCPRIAEAEGGAAVVAGSVAHRRGTRFEVLVAIREPGGRFGPPVRLGDGGLAPAVAVSPAGHAVVLWIEPAGDGRLRAVAARRAPGGEFGAPETLASWRGQFPDTRVAAAMDATGATTLLWAREVSERRGGGTRVEAAIAAPGAAFAVQRLTSSGNYTETLALDVAADGWTLLAYEGGFAEAPVVYERAPGTTSFARLATPAPPQHAGFAEPAVAIREGGGGVVAWRRSVTDGGDGVEALTLAAGGAFAPSRIVAGPRARGSAARESFDLYDPFDVLAGPPVDVRDHELEAALTAEGRVLLAWIAGTGRRPLRARGAYAALGTLDGGFEPVQSVGAPLRDTADVAPLFLAGDRAAVAWTDNSARLRDGRLHVAVEASPRPAPRPAPRLTVHRSAPQRLYDSQPLRLDVSCDRACDLRTIVKPGGHLDGVTRLGGGRRSLDLGETALLQPGEARRIRVIVRASAPGGGATVERTRFVRVIRRAPLPVRRPLDVRARRRGGSILVTWRTAAPARRQWFFVSAHEARRPSEEFVVIGNNARRRGGGRTSFAVRLRPDRPERLRWVAVVPEGFDAGGVDGPGRVVRVTG